MITKWVGTIEDCICRKEICPKGWSIFFPEGPDGPIIFRMHKELDFQKKRVYLDEYAKVAPIGRAGD